MQYETETSYRLYLSNDLPEQSLFIEQTSLRSKPPFLCESKIVQPNETKTMTIVFNNSIKVHVNSVLILVYIWCKCIMKKLPTNQYSAFSTNSRYANLTYKI